MGAFEKKSGSTQTFDRLIDWIVRWFRPAWVRNRTALFLARYERFGPLQWLDLPDGQRMSVIAPHPDDESIGCGGLIAQWMQQGRQCDTVFLTAGESGDRRLRQKNLAQADADKIRTETAEIRRAEAQTAIDILGGRGHWLDGTDGALHLDEDRLIAALKTIWIQSPPNVICVPFPADRHADHAVAARIVAAASMILELPPIILSFEVWSPAPINALCDINETAEKKWLAIAAHSSQVVTTDYVTAAMALNSYRAIAGGRSGYAEGYFKTNRDEFAEIAAALDV